VTIPVLKDLTEQVGRSHVRVQSLLSGYENEHTYSPKPSDLVAVRKAHLLFEIGMGLEVWVASLVKTAGSPSLRVVTTSQGIGVIHDDTEHRHGPHEGETAGGASGNPHIWLDPDNAVIMLRHIAEALMQIDPAHSDEYRNNLAAYLQQLDLLRTELSRRVQSLPDRRFIATIRPGPISRGTSVLRSPERFRCSRVQSRRRCTCQSLITLIKKSRIAVIVSEVQLSQRLPSLLAKETRARVVVLTTLPGGLPGTETYLDMLRYNVLQLADALSQA
jgi:ABC-type metal ion transport system, periplasmic component/surface adhesin